MRTLVITRIKELLNEVDLTDIYWKDQTLALFNGYKQKRNGRFDYKTINLKWLIRNQDKQLVRYNDDVLLKLLETLIKDIEGHNAYLNETM